MRKEWLGLSFYTPFYTQDFQISKTKAEFYLELAHEEAINILNELKSADISAALTMLIFDCLMDDYVEMQRGGDAVIWRATCFMYGLHESEIMAKINSKLEALLN